MDNNQNNMFNSQQPVQPNVQQNTNLFGGQPAQQPGGNPFANQPMGPKTSANMSVIALIGAGVALLMAIIGSIFACTCSASKSYSADSMVNSVLGMLGGSATMDIFSTSAVIVVNIIAAVIAVVSVILAILEIKKNPDDKMAKIAVALGGFAAMYAILPMLTICGYNCSMNSNASLK